MRFVINPSGNPAASSDRWLTRPDLDGVAGSCVWQPLGGNEDALSVLANVELDGPSRRARHADVLPGTMTIQPATVRRVVRTSLDTGHPPTQ